MGIFTMIKVASYIPRVGTPYPGRLLSADLTRMECFVLDYRFRLLIIRGSSSPFYKSSGSRRRKSEVGALLQSVRWHVRLTFSVVDIIALVMRTLSRICSIGCSTKHRRRRDEGWLGANSFYYDVCIDLQRAFGDR